ncbi:MAG TPA: alpha/beta hydrolase-fold protein [Ilumatobacteraceae bacterium]
MRAFRVVVVATVVLASCGSDNASTSPTTGTSPSPATGPSSASSTSANSDSDLQHLTFVAKDGTAIDYVMLVPPGRATGQPGKVLLTFPPGGQDPQVTERVVEDKFHDEAVARGWVVVSPAAPTTGLFYENKSAALVPELLDHIAAEYPPEGGKFDLAGVSNGGLSAFKAALSFPDRFRSLVVFPGYSQDGGDDPNLSKLKDIGVSMFVGGDDSGWRQASEQTEATLKGLGYTVELHVVPGEPHIIASLTGADLFDAIERVRA